MCQASPTEAQARASAGWLDHAHESVEHHAALRNHAVEHMRKGFTLAEPVQGDFEGVTIKRRSAKEWEVVRNARMAARRRKQEQP